ncbi:MAG: LysM peptidoglycan-binding domain-containing protein [Polyangiaceae bacterium]|nr:LysM peptidoglycan-binding domain-containing protein [Polyangiaceae bacterium]
MVGRRRTAGGWAGLGLLVGGLGVGASEVPSAAAEGCPAGMADVRGRFCIDRYEASVDLVDARGRTVGKQSPYLSPEPGQAIRARSRSGVVPQAYISQVDAAAACAAAGKRLCTDAEWVLACKGRVPTRYPYGDEHQAGRCNDAGVSPLRRLHGRDDSEATFGMEAMNDSRLNRIPGTVARTGAFARCRNGFGIYDMVGNLHEWTAASGGTFRGGYYLDTRINGEGCDYQTTAHSTFYHDYSIGFRCCKSHGGGTVTLPPPSPSPTTGATRAKAGLGEKVHVVDAGDTLSGLSARYHVPVDAIRDRNHLDRTTPLRIGRELVVPSPSAAPTAGSKEAPARSPGAAASAGSRVHTVAPGQTLSGIAARYGVTVAALCAANHLDRHQPIRPGQELRIPPRPAHGGTARK